MRTIRVRLTVLYVALLAVILVIFSAFLYLSQSRSLHASFDQELAAAAQQVIASLDVENGSPHLGEQPPPGALAWLYSPDGQLLQSSDPAATLPRPATAMAPAKNGGGEYETVASGGSQGWRVLTRPVTANGRVVAILEVARSEQDIQGSLRRLLMLMGVAVPLTLLLAVGAGLFLAGKALGPIDQITRNVNQISGEDLSKRLLLPPTRDEVGRLAATFDAMLDRLERAFERERQFTADASHELRTPLAVLISEADVALGRPRTPSEYRRVLESMRADASRMSGLVNALLTLARVDAGRDLLTCEQVRLDQLACNVVESMAPLADAKGVHLEAQVCQTVEVVGDETRLAQLVVNLVDNAIKYTPAGGTVAVAAASAEDWVELSVRDTGIGIPSEHLDRIFERFYRVDASRSETAPSAGLGLAMVEWIVRAHGGDIALESQVGSGTTVRVRLPLPARG